jgi:hypothetical protein
MTEMVLRGYEDRVRREFPQASAREVSGGVIAAQSDRLDLPYLAEWAKYLRVADLLEQASAG